MEHAKLRDSDLVLCFVPDTNVTVAACTENPHLVSFTEAKYMSTLNAISFYTMQTQRLKGQKGLKVHMCVSTRCEQSGPKQIILQSIQMNHSALRDKVQSFFRRKCYRCVDSCVFALSHFFMYGKRTHKFIVQS